MTNPLARSDNDVLRLIRYSWRLSPLNTVFAVLSALLSAGLLVAVPIFTGRVIGMLPGVVAAGLDPDFNQSLAALLILLVVGHGVGLVAKSAGEQLIGLSERDATSRIGLALSDSPDLSVAEDSDAAAQVQKVRNRRWEIEMALRMATGPGITQWLGLIGTSVALAVTLSPWVAVLLFLGALAEGEYLRRIIMTEMDVWSGQTEPQKHAYYAFEQGMGKSAKEIRIFGLTGFIRRRWWDNITSAYLPYWRKRRRGAMINLAIGGGRVLVTCAAIGYAAWLASDGRIDLTALATALSLIMAIGSTDLWSLGQLQRGVAVLAWLDRIAPAKAVLQRIRTSPRTAPEPAPVPAGAPSIVFDDVTFRYPGAESDILRGLSWELPAGDAVALVGVNGAGKSTLVKLACGAYLPTSGRVLVGGVDLADLDLDQRRAWQRRVAPITQDFVRLPLAAGDNVALGTGRIWSGRIDLAADRLPDTTELDATAERAGIVDLIEKLKTGWGTPLSKTIPGGTDLSGGEWQRIGLARALRAVAAGAGVLILDEPAAALDVESEARMVDSYLELTSGVTSLIISHRFSVVRPVPRICVLEGGRITEAGSHEELMAAAGRYAAMFRLQASRYVDDHEPTVPELVENGEVAR
ncbi:ATP-binding cassette domain-containing protein [Microlunatus parietis]|uniref:ATP-binding cassette subfamily B protein n=1 Tax=Microlunatus parietis TaxID=682979 RepID=A0A7Y9IDU3_9ACTN|nr:ABC transporter ATP-binding protein [Microlunatus parietis]NYE75108.1 ATP-binding cassette subfamily B protein [Microlunatus parietis]